MNSSATPGGIGQLSPRPPKNRLEIQQVENGYLIHQQGPQYITFVAITREEALKIVSEQL